MDKFKNHLLFATALGVVMLVGGLNAKQERYVSHPQQVSHPRYVSHPQYLSQ